MTTAHLSSPELILLKRILTTMSLSGVSKKKRETAADGTIGRCLEHGFPWATRSQPIEPAASATEEKRELGQKPKLCPMAHIESPGWSDPPTCRGGGLDSLQPQGSWTFFFWIVEKSQIFFKDK